MPKRIRRYVLAGLPSMLFVLGTAAAQAQGGGDTKPPVVTSAPTLNFYGVPGLVDMPSGEALPDGQLALGISHFGGQTRTSLTFQFSPRISGTFRYIGIQDWNSDGFDTYRDRSFDVRFLLIKERRYLPAVSIGLQDFAGTGIYAAEYVAATKTFKRPFLLPGTVKVTGGLGWGRLGSLGEIGSLSGTARPSFNPGDSGGEPATDQWFRGPVAPFAGIEWQVSDRLGLKAEYSSDAYEPETSRGVFDRDSRLNFGAEYQVNQRIRLGAYWLYGSEIGVNAQIQLNPNKPVTPFTLAAPPQVAPRPERASNPDAYGTAWAASQNVPVAVRDAVAADLQPQGIRLESITVAATRVEARVSSIAFDNLAIVTGRTARSLARVLPASVETFDIILVNDGLALSRITLSRSDLEQLEFQPSASDRLLANSTLDSAAPRASRAAAVVDANYPRFSYSLGPFVRPSYFDPDQPVRIDVGVSLDGAFRIAPGLKIAGDIRYRLDGNIGDSPRLSNSVLPRVRTDGVLYARESDFTMEELYISQQWKPGKDFYARLTGGYLEQMFGGLSAELLWKPVNNRLALGAEINYARQRDFDQQFGFRDYDVITGHASAYYDFGQGYFAQVDVGRYLAGDVGATFTVERQFANGFRVGGFFTLTDVSAEDFGEGSFDKGISFSIPLTWLTGRPSKQRIGTTIRPVQRDGGARLVVPGRLYEQIRDGHAEDLLADWGRVWE
ncbi:MAG: YjbH domain-containing protein [Tateyamaria sp.]